MYFNYTLVFANQKNVQGRQTDLRKNNTDI